MIPYSHRFSKYAFILFLLAVLGYAFFEIRGIAFGPKISVSNTQLEMHYPFVRIEGTATHIEELKMNGAPISVTETGTFSEPYLLAPGGNRIILEAKDKYGHSTQQVVEIVYTLLNATSSSIVQPLASSTPTHATTTSSAKAVSTSTATSTSSSTTTRRW